MFNDKYLLSIGKTGSSKVVEFGRCRGGILYH